MCELLPAIVEQLTGNCRNLAQCNAPPGLVQRAKNEVRHERLVSCSGIRYVAPTRRMHHTLDKVDILPDSMLTGICVDKDVLDPQ